MIRIPSIITFLSIASGLSLIVHFSSFPLLIAQRLAGIEAAYIEIICIATYGAWITSLMNTPTKRARTRKNIWLLFTLIFFTQLILGLWGFEDFLQNRKIALSNPCADDIRTNI